MTISQVMEELCGLEVSRTQLSRASQLLDEELATWRNRPLGRFPYVFFDARYQKVRHGGTVVSCAVLIAVGLGEDGNHCVLRVSVSLSEAELHWRTFMERLRSPGLHGVALDHQR